MPTLGINLLVCFLTILLCDGMGATQSSGMSMASNASDVSTAGKTRTYYIAADEVMWDYVPGGRDEIKGKPFESVGMFIGGSNPGPKPVKKPVPTAYLKTLYREYTDNTFRVLKPRPAEWGASGLSWSPHKS